MTEDDAPLDPVPLDARPGLLGALARHRRVLLVAGVLWFGLVMGGGIFLSGVDARYGLHVFGTGTWVAGEPAVIRAALRDLAFNRYQPLGPLTVTLTDAEGQPAPPQRVVEPVGAWVQGTITAPGRPGAWQVEIEARGPDGPVTARFPITVQPAAAAAAWPAPPPPRHPPRPDVGPWRLDLRPLDAVLPGGLPGALVVQAADAAGRPLATAVTLDVREGQSAKPIPSRIVTDRHGIATIDVRPIHPVFLVELRAGEPAGGTADGTPDGIPAAPDGTGGTGGTGATDGTLDPTPAAPDATDGTPDPTRAAPDATDGITPSAPPAPTATVALRRVAHTPTQFAIAVPEGPVAPGAALPIQLRSLHQTGPVFIDLWHGDRWIGAAAATLEAGAAATRITLPPLPEDPALVWVQALQNTYLPGDARAGRHLLVTAQPTAAAARHVAGRLAAAGYDPPLHAALAADADDSPRLLRALLGRLPRPAAEPPLLADSGVTARQTVTELKTVWESRFVLALVASGALLFIVLGVLLVTHQRALRRQWHAAGGDDEGAPGTRQRLWIDAGYMLLVLALFLLAMIQLLLAIRW